MTDYDAITIQTLEIEIPLDYDHLIFSSQNGVYAYLQALNRNKALAGYKDKGCFCVGDKTRRLLEANHIKVLFSAPNGAELAYYLINHHSAASLLYICSSRRRDELPTLLAGSGLLLKEVVGYQTHLNTIKHSRNFDGLLFFSPSGVESFMSHNKHGDATAYCIGPTTAAAVKEYTNRFKIAKEASLEALIQLALDSLKPPISSHPDDGNNKQHL